MRCPVVAISLLVSSILGCAADDIVSVEPSGQARRANDEPPERTMPAELASTGKPSSTAASPYDSNAGKPTPTKPKPSSASGAAKPAAGAPPAPAKLPAELEALLGSASNESPRGVRSVEAIVEGSVRLRAHPELAPTLGDRLEPICRDLYFGEDVIPGMERLGLRRHAVRKGESPWKIARAMVVDPALITRLNPKIEPTRLRVDQRVKVVDLSSSEIELDVDLAAHRLALYRIPADGGAAQLMLYVPVATGEAKTPTPRGTTKISRITPSPMWVDSKTGKTAGPNDASNPWGAVRILLDAEALDVERMQIHGRPGRDDSEFAGKAVTDGDLWLRTEDLVRLSECLREGAHVTIH